LRAWSDHIYDQSAIDIDGDSLVYSFCTPFNYPYSPFITGISSEPPIIEFGVIPPAPPYELIQWADYFNEDIPLGKGYFINFRGPNGLLEIAPEDLGNFMVAICVSEYRNGELLGTVMREFQANVVEILLSQKICTCVDSLASNWCNDVNGNGRGNPEIVVKSCSQPEGFVADCTDVNDLVSINGYNENLFSVYPIPTGSHFKIELNETLLNNAYISLYTTNGQLVFEPKLITRNQLWSIPDDLLNGLYYVQLNFKNEVYQEKLIVLR